MYNKLKFVTFLLQNVFLKMNEMVFLGFNLEKKIHFETMM